MVAMKSANAPLLLMLACLVVPSLVVAAGEVPVIALGGRSLTSQTFVRVHNLAIPDATMWNPGAEVTSTIDVPLGRVVAGLEVYLNITHGYTSDLIVRLNSPVGTTLGIAWIGEGGEPEVNIVGWYPGDFTPHDDLHGCDGQFTEGVWTLRLRDYSYDYAGHLNEWRLKVYYDTEVADADQTWGGIKTLFR
jgi:subtilisin-like proprotein convertase family protein